MVRLLRAFPELMILIKAVVVGGRCVVFAGVLLLTIVYIFAILFRQLSKGREAVGTKFFPSVPYGMSVLLLELGVFPDQAQDIREVSAADPLLAIFITLFVIVALVTVMNLLIGIMCEAVSAVARVEKDNLAIGGVKDKLRGIYRQLDTDGDMTITAVEFQALLGNQDAVRAIQDVGVDVLNLLDFTEILFATPGSSLSFPDFVDMMLKLRGQNTATVKDVVAVSHKLNTIAALVKDLHPMLLHPNPSTLVRESSLCRHSEDLVTPFGGELR